jgi:hypothetical protein
MVESQPRPLVRTDEESGIDCFPFEILSRIFTACAEDDAIESMFPTGFEGVMGDESKFNYSLKPSSRVDRFLGLPILKLAAQSLPDVCGRWRAIVNEPINAHLFFIQVHFAVDRQRDLTSQMACMCHRLRTSAQETSKTSCDVYASFRGGGFPEGREQEALSVSKLLFHSILLLKKYRYRVAFIFLDLWWYQWDLLKMLSLHEWPRLQGVYHSTWRIKPPIPSEPLGLFDQPEIEHGIPGQINTALGSLSFLSLTPHLEQRDISHFPPSPIPAYVDSPRLHHLV